MSRIRNTRARLVALLAGFLLIGLGYSLVVPPFEAPDELFHYAFARHLAAGHGLPVQNPEVEAPWEQEGSQAPLYYWLVGRLTAAIDQDDFARISVRNPRANIGDPLFPGNKNFMLYSSVDWPLVGANLALHVGRWFSLLLGLVTLLCTWITARLAFAERPGLAWITTLIVAAIPQFGFISAALTNDTLIIAASAATLAWLAGLIRWHFADQRPIPIWHWLVLGGLLGIAALSKLQGLGLFLLSALVGVGLAWQRRDWRLLLRAFLPVALPALLIAGWWYGRNLSLYGDWSGLGHLLANNGRREDPLTLSGFWREFRGLRYSFWGLFGWFNLLLPQWIYNLLDGITLAALAGLGLRGLQGLRRRSGRKLTPQQAIRGMLALWALLSAALLIYWTLQATGSQGRLLFPGIGALIVMLVLGLEVWIRRLPSRWQALAWSALPALLLGCSLYALLSLLPASYRAPAPIAAPPATAIPVDAIYGTSDQLRVLGYDLPDQRYTVGDVVPITLYLKSDKPVGADYQLFIQLLDENRVEVANLTSHPGWGRNPTSLWQPGAIYADTYPLLISGPVADWAPLLAHLYIGFVDPQTESSGRFPIPAQTTSGAALDPPFLGQVAIRPREPATLANVELVGATFGGVIALSGYALSQAEPLQAGQPLTLTVQWDVLATPAAAYTAFVHVRQGGTTVVGFDQAPAGQRFPTQYWRAGDRILDQVPLALPAELPAGEYEVWVGLYETASQGTLRLPITSPGGLGTGDGEVLIGRVRVGE